MSKRVGAAIFTGFVVALILAGCASSRSTVADEGTAFTVTTPSGRVVECIEYNGGLSCDWERAQ